MITDLVSQIVVERNIPAEWKLRTIVCRFFRKRKLSGTEINRSDS